MLGVVRSEFVGNNCACCVNRRSGRVAEAGKFVVVVFFFEILILFL